MSLSKIVIVGNGGVGKSTLLKKINTGIFNNEYETTIGYAKHSMTFLTNRGTKTIQLIDTAGQEEIGTINFKLYNNIDGAIIMFDLTSRITNNAIPTWYRDLQKITKNKNLPIVIVGNKLDLERKVKQSQITYPAKNNIPYVETSVKNNDNLINIFNILFQKIYDDNDIHCIVNNKQDVPKKVIFKSKKRKLSDNDDKFNDDDNDKSNEGDKKVRDLNKRRRIQPTKEKKNIHNYWHFL